MTDANVPLLTFDPEADASDGAVRADLKKLVSGKLLVQAGSGAGKSWLIRYMLEQTHGRVQHIVFDPERQLTTLRQSYDYILIGPGEDLEATPENAAALARGTMELEASAICDLADMKREDRYAFVGNYLSALIDLPDELRRPLLLVVDEAHQFAPQDTRTESRAALEDVATRGRIRGLGLVAVTQRMSLLSKTVVSQCENRVVGRTTLGNDLRRAASEMGFSSKERTQIRKLRTGEFFVYGPAISFEVTRARSGGVETKHVEPGEVAPPAPPPAEEMREALASLRAGMSEEEDGDDESSGGEASPGADDYFQRKNQRLRAENERLQEEVQDLRERLGIQAGRAKAFRRGLDEAAACIEEALNQEGDFDKWEDDLQGKSTGPDEGVVEVPIFGARQSDSPDERSGSDLPSAQTRILHALAKLETLGVESATREVAAVFSDQSPKSSAYTAHVAALKRAGLIHYPAPGALALTAEGRGAAPPVQAPGGLEDVHAAWKRYARSNLGATESRMIDVLIREHPHALAREALAAAVDRSPKSSAFTDQVATLKSLGVVDYPQAGHVSASALLFPPDLT